jgi:hypothetical protein
MNIPLEERGAYYRGLLVLIRRDRNINECEREMMLQFGQMLDFDKRFCEVAISDAINNRYIKDKPMSFSEKTTAESFLHHGILLALADNELHPKEWTWLKKVAKENGIEEEWLKTQLKQAELTHHENEKTLTGATE